MLASVPARWLRNIGSALPGCDDSRSDNARADRLLLCPAAMGPGPIGRSTPKNYVKPSGQPRRDPRCGAPHEKWALGTALRLMRSKHARAFDLSQVPAKSLAAYGDSDFGRVYLLAQWLVESGAPFVEVYLANWSTHVIKVADQSRALMSQVGAGELALVRTKISPRE